MARRSPPGVTRAHQGPLEPIRAHQTALPTGRPVLIGIVPFLIRNADVRGDEMDELAYVMDI